MTDYKKLFGTKDVILTNVNREELGAEVESVDYMTEYTKKKNRFAPPVDFSKPKNFARFGSAEKYYTDAIDRIYKTYPYDGSLKERVDWELSSSHFDLYIFDKGYPRTNGYVILSAEGWGTQVADSDGYGATATASYEYIYVEGGPHTSYRAKGQDIENTSGDYKDGYANIWEPSKDRESNLKIDGIDGNTVEFWMKKSEFVTSKTGREVIFDAYTSDFISSSVNYGRLTIEMTGTTAASPFLLTYMSGTSGFSDEVVGSSITTSSIADDSWHHYAFVLKNSGNNVEINFYVDSACNQTIITGSSINYVSGNINATLGSLITAPSGTAAPTKGWGKLSGSLDEFRFWKKARTSQQIGRQYIQPVGGGTNTDDANTDLGVYYKFNAGITLTASVDKNILDYSGRISNGTFTGYNSSTRNTGSAMVQSGKVSTEFKDPILYNFHPDVANFRSDKILEGREYDYSNNSSIYFTMPAWITEEDELKDKPPLKDLTQIIGSYFDSLSYQISTLPKLKHKNYLSSSYKSYPFTNKLLQSVGFDYFPELFSDATLFEQFRNRDDKLLFKQKLYDVKNRIYQNIYNNIVYIYKTKGTEKSFRNLIRCFGVDDEIYKINLYGDRVTYELKDNYKSVSEHKKYANFTLTGTFEATVFPVSSSTNPNSTSFLSGSGVTTRAYENAGLAFTMESEVVFPIRGGIADSNVVRHIKDVSSTVINSYIPFKSASLFGVHQVSGTTENDLTWVGTDYANFQVLAIRDKDFSKRCRFTLQGVGSSVFPTLTSSYFDNVFDDTRWNFAVSVRPESYPEADIVSGSDISDYRVEFYGVEKVLDSTRNEFLLTGSISNTNGRRFMANPKSVFIGAHRENFSGSLQQRADGNISSTKVWLTYIPTGTVQQHAQDVKSYGPANPYKSAYLYQSSLTGTHVPEIHTLALNWIFDTVTGSDASGEFVGQDFSSGSTSLQTRYGWIGDVIGKQYLPKGYNFPANFSSSINNKYVYSAKKQLPETIFSADMTNVLSEDDLMFNKNVLLRPINYYMYIEKSMYQTISEEMIKMFSSIKDFNNLIGDPVNKYRDEYKRMSKLRQLFFERVGNTPDLDKYIEFYKWIDATLDVMLEYLIPASMHASDEYGNNIKNLVESHVLERNKYKWQFPTLEDRTQVPQGNLLGINELLYDWEFGHAPVDNTQQDDNCLWWKQRAERDGVLTSGDSGVDSDKQTILNVLDNQTNANNYTLYDSASSADYSGSTYVIRKLAKPYKLKADQMKEQHGGANFYQNKKIGFFDAINQFKAGSAYAHQRADRSFLDDYVDGTIVEGCDDNRQLDNGKKKLSFLVKSRVGGGIFTAADEYKGQKVFPFSFYSASIAGGVNTLINDDFIDDVDITNMHIDSTNLDGEVPAQGPFTEKFVGGRTYRHIFSNFSPNQSEPDGTDSRLEGYVLDLSTNAFKLYNADYGRVNLMRSQYFRNVRTKRPVNIRNIQQFTGAASAASIKPGYPGQVMNATNIGNYSKDYEVVMTNDRSLNNTYFRDNDGVTATSVDAGTVTNVKTFALPLRTSSSDWVIVNKFSAPGGPSTMGPGYLDLEANEYSVYNAMPWRNIIVRDSLDEWYTDHAKQFGFFSDAQYSSSWALALSSGFGVGAYPGASGSVSVSGYAGTASYHKTNRNPLKVAKFIGATTSSYMTGTVYDNWFVQHPIPRSDYQYQWITASADVSVNPFLGYEQPDLKNASLASTDITFISQSHIENSNGVKVDFVGMNSIVVDTVDSASNTLTSGDTDFENTTFGSVDSTQKLNALNLHRNGPYGWASWQQTRGGNNQIIRSYRQNNRHSFISDTTIFNSRTNKLIKIVQLDSQIEPPITSKYKPFKHQLQIKGSGGNTKDVRVKNTYGNELSKFTEKISGSINMNDNAGIIFRDNSPKTLIYDSLNYFVLGQELSTDANPVNKLNSVVIEETIWPREHFTYLKKVRQRTNFQNNFWRETRSERNIALSNSQGVSPTDADGNILTASIWNLDARTDFSKAEYVAFKAKDLLFGSGSEGELQNAYSLFHSGVSGLPLAATNYNRRIPETYDCAGGVHGCTGNPVLFAGDTKWEAASQAGIDPSYKDYDSYVEDLKRIGKDYGIIPEFRISEHIPFYINTKGGDFLAKRASYLTLTGASVPDSSDNNFYKIYANSDFMKYFDLVKTDYNDVVGPSTITLKCNALMKFLPYDGFYPAQRTTELATLFSESYGPTMTGSYNFRTALQPLFAPGILYNSIKSGIAVDYPIVTGSLDANISITGSQANSTLDAGNPRLSGTFDYRVPFEALVSPNLYLDGKAICDSEPHPSASINSTASFGVAENPLFRLAMNNFLAEVPSFFLAGGKLTSLESLPDNNKFTVEANKKYMMRIVCSHSRYRKLYDIENSIAEIKRRGHPSYIYNPPTITMYNRSFNLTTGKDYQRRTVGEDTTAVSEVISDGTFAYGTSFGPPCDARDVRASTEYSCSSFEPYTPPYYNGYSHIELSYTPDISGEVNISDIMPHIRSSASFYRESTRYHFTASTAGIEAMQLSASLLWDQIVREPIGNTLDENGNVISRDATAYASKWVIQPKWETPILDFNDATITLPTFGSSSVAKGMWHQYGSIPSSAKGVFLSVQDLNPAELNSQRATGSLVRLLGFDKTRSEVKLGTVSQQKNISEAIVAIPFFINSNSDRTFFNINREIINRSQLILKGQQKLVDDLNESVPLYKPATSTVEMVERMQKYVIPPQFDFLINETVDPFAMLIFEFKATLNQADLVNIWQNLPPQSLSTIATGSYASISVDLISQMNAVEGLSPSFENYKGWGLLTQYGTDSSPAGLPTNIQWLVFKAKQKAEKNYYKLTADTTDDERFKFTFKEGTQAGKGQIPNYSYNWPYDYFSLVELAKFDSSVKLSGSYEPTAVPFAEIISSLGEFMPTEAHMFLPPGSTQQRQSQPTTSDRVVAAVPNIEESQGGGSNR